MLDVLNTYDWGEVFKYAVPDQEAQECLDVVGLSIAPFTRDDVVKIVKHRDGERDGEPWQMIGLLSDGRYFYIQASCDYTGWS